MNTKLMLLAAASAAMIAGCNPGATTAETDSGVAPVPTKTFTFKPNTDIGVPIEASTDAAAFPRLVATRGSVGGPARSDPFALTSAEQKYDTSQMAERLSGQEGFSTMFTPPSASAETPPVYEPQPYRRLAGVVVGDSVVAIIEMGNGSTEIIRPGMMIPNSEWKVVSIDEDKAVLRRSGNTLPKEIIVRLESPPPGMSAPTGGLGGAPSNFGPGGIPPGAGAPRFGPPGAGGKFGGGAE